MPYLYGAHRQSWQIPGAGEFQQSRRASDAHANNTALGPRGGLISTIAELAASISVAETPLTASNAVMKSSRLMSLPAEMRCWTFEHALTLTNSSR